MSTIAIIFLRIALANPVAPCGSTAAPAAVTLDLSGPAEAEDAMPAITKKGPL